MQHPLLNSERRKKQKSKRTQKEHKTDCNPHFFTKEKKSANETSQSQKLQHVSNRKPQHTFNIIRSLILI